MLIVLNSPGETRRHIHWVWVSYSVCPKNMHHLECFIDSLKLSFLIEPLREPFASVCCIGNFGNVQNHKPPASLQQPQAPVLPKLPFCAHSFLQLIKRSLLYATNEIELCQQVPNQRCSQSIAAWPQVISTKWLERSFICACICSFWFLAFWENYHA